VTPERYAKRKLKGLPRAELLYTADTLPDVKNILHHRLYLQHFVTAG